MFLVLKRTQCAVFLLAVATASLQGACETALTPVARGGSSARTGTSVGYYAAEAKTGMAATVAPVSTGLLTTASIRNYISPKTLVATCTIGAVTGGAVYALYKNRFKAKAVNGDYLTFTHANYTIKAPLKTPAHVQTADEFFNDNQPKVFTMQADEMWLVDGGQWSTISTVINATKSWRCNKIQKIDKTKNFFWQKETYNIQNIVEDFVHHMESNQCNQLINDFKGTLIFSVDASHPIFNIK